MADSDQTAITRIQMILEFLHERNMDIEGKYDLLNE